MKFKAIIFDLDGTLIDSIPDIADAANQLMVNHNYPTHDPLLYVQWIGNGALKLIEQALLGNANEVSLPGLLHEYLDIHTRNCTNKTRLYPGIDNLLNYLNGQKISISILTNKPDGLAQKVFEHYLSEWSFDFVIGQMPDFPKKPDPMRAIEIADKINCTPHEMLFIGDSDTDMKTGNAAGMVPVGVTWGYDTKSSVEEAGAKYLMQSVQELLSFIKTNT